MACLGGRRHRPAAGTSAAQLEGLRGAWLAAAVVLLCVVACGATSAVEGTGVHMVGLVPTGLVTDARAMCVSQFAGYLPSLVTVALDEEMQALVVKLQPQAQMHAALSGTIGTSKCTTSADCIWQWREGPYTNNPLTFYVGDVNGVQQPPGTNYYYRWRLEFPKETPSRTQAYFHLRDNEGWCAYWNKYTVGAVICEAPITTVAPTTPKPTPIPPEPTPTPPEPTSTPPEPTPTPPEPTPTPAEPTITTAESSASKPTVSVGTIPEAPLEDQKSPSHFPWWVGVIIALGVVLATSLITCALCCCCRRKKKQEEVDEATDEPDSTHDDNDPIVVQQVDWESSGYSGADEQHYADDFQCGMQPWS